jgi:hypothetical protein
MKVSLPSTECDNNLLSGLVPRNIALDIRYHIGELDMMGAGFEYKQIITHLEHEGTAVWARTDGIVGTRCVFEVVNQGIIEI